MRPEPIRILVVCTANRCRSPVAEVLLWKALVVEGVPAVVRSAGFLEPGVPVDEFEVHDDRAQFVPVPFTSRLRPDPARHFASNGRAPSAMRRAVPAAGGTLAAIVILEQLEESATVSLSRLRGPAAVRSLLPHAYWFDFSVERSRPTVESYLRAATIVPVHLLQFPGRLEAVDQVVDELQRLVTT
jgi:hypothetical protein